MMRNIGYTALILAGLVLFAFAQDPTTFTTLAVTGTSTFTGAITATGGVVGDVTGSVITVVAAEGNLPAAAAGNAGHIYANAAYDTLFVSTGSAWLSWADD